MSMTREEAVALVTKHMRYTTGFTPGITPTEWVVQAILEASSGDNRAVINELARADGRMSAIRETAQDVTGELLIVPVSDAYPWREALLEQIMASLKGYKKYVTNLEARHDFLLSTLFDDDDDYKEHALSLALALNEQSPEATVERAMDICRYVGVK